MSQVPEPLPDEEEHFRLLDAYLEALHSGQEQERQQLLRNHPELVEALRCLDSLDRLAIPSSSSEVSTVYFPLGEAAEKDFPPATAILPDLVPEGYEILEEIGAGGMGVVFKARHKELQRIVALKMIRDGYLASADQIERFYIEARASATLQHPNIVSIYEIGQVHGRPFFAMRYVEGPTLADKIAGGKLLAEEAARCVCVIARAVGYLHDQGIVHRDLKPSNVLLDNEGQPHVTDFGLAKMLRCDDHKTNTGAILGTASYMPPEQAAGRVRDIGPASDVYSLGAILYETLTGRPPFRGPTMLDTIVQVLEGEPLRPRQLNASVPRELEQICLRCLEKDPAQRYSSGHALAEDLERFLKGEMVEHQKASVDQRLRRWARREPALASRLVGLGLCAAIVQINYFFREDISLWMHLLVLAILGVWVGASVVLQQCLNHHYRPTLMRIIWSACDIAFLTAALILFNDANSPIVVLYAVLIAGSGLWFQTGLVWFTTVLSILGYAVLVLEAYSRNQGYSRPHHHIIYLVGLAVLGYVVAYQVQRVRALSRYYEQRPLP